MSDQPSDWQPLVQLPNDVGAFSNSFINEVTRHYGLKWDDAKAWLERAHAGSQFYSNDLYHVEVGSTGTGGLRITIRRIDGSATRDWRHFQEIKNQLAGEECEAVELYPAESRKVDTSNKWHLWVLPRGVTFDFGWPQRDVRFDASDTPGLQQRAL
jgi:hypothetical protein